MVEFTEKETLAHTLDVLSLRVKDIIRDNGDHISASAARKFEEVAESLSRIAIELYEEP